MMVLHQAATLELVGELEHASGVMTHRSGGSLMSRRRRSSASP
jgi:hypothetical protein